MKLDMEKLTRDTHSWWDIYASNPSSELNSHQMRGYSLLAVSVFESLFKQIEVKDLYEALEPLYADDEKQALKEFTQGIDEQTSLFNKLQERPLEETLLVVIDKLIKHTRALEAASSALGDEWNTFRDTVSKEIDTEYDSLTLKDINEISGKVNVAGRDIVSVDSRGIFIKDAQVTIYQSPIDERHSLKEPLEKEVIQETEVSDTLSERDWKLLLRRIRDGKCTPFLGAGINQGVLPLGQDIAKKWAKKHNYPLNDADDLARVAQYLAIEYDPMFPKEEILEEWFKNLTSPNFSLPDDPHSVLAQLPLPIFITTNYDDFMFQALKHQKKSPQKDICKWNKLVQEHDSVSEEYVPTPASPYVFHLHGHSELPESLVLTEDDYLGFLVRISDDRDVIPPLIKGAIAGSSLLFIGYRLADWNFRVIRQGLVDATDKSLRRISVTVQLPPLPQDSPEAKLQQNYLTKYFDSKDIRVYWGTAQEFTRELGKRWKEFTNEN